MPIPLINPSQLRPRPITGNEPQRPVYESTFGPTTTSATQASSQGSLFSRNPITSIRKPVNQSQQRRLAPFKASTLPFTPAMPPNLNLKQEPVITNVKPDVGSEAITKSNLLESSQALKDARGAIISLFPQGNGNQQMQSIREARKVGLSEKEITNALLEAGVSGDFIPDILKHPQTQI